LLGADSRRVLSGRPEFSNGISQIFLIGHGKNLKWMGHGQELKDGETEADSGLEPLTANA